MLNHRIAIHVPSTIHGNEPAPAVHEQWVKKAKMKFSELFGGFNATPAVGGWMSETLGLIEESVVIVTAFTDTKGLREHLPTVKDFAKSMGQAMTQEAITVEVDNSMDFITP